MEMPENLPQRRSINRAADAHARIPDLDLDLACLTFATASRRRSCARQQVRRRGYRRSCLARRAIIENAQRHERRLANRRSLPRLTAPGPQQGTVHTVPQSHLRNLRSRFKARSENPGLLFGRPAPPPGLAGYQLDPTVAAGLVPVLMPGIKTRI